MALRVFGCFRIHVRVAHPVRLDLILAAVLSFRPIDEIHRTERRLDFRFFRVLLHHDVSVADSFACRFDRECRSAPRIVAVDDRVKRKRTFWLIRTGFVVCNVDSLQSKTLW